jgi:hypothetical protein
MGCGCGGGASRMPLTSGDYAAAQEAGAQPTLMRFRVVRTGEEDALFATYALARRAAGITGGVVRTLTADQVAALSAPTE